MNILLKLILLIISLFFMTAQCLADTQVIHFNESTKQWGNNQTIPNMNTINSLITAGSKYAWAIGNNHSSIAFYNGTQWKTAVQIAHITKITSLHPGYPVTGKEGIAWLLGTDSVGNYYVTYFDGINWTAAQKLDATTAVLNTSSGIAWLTCLSSKPPSYTVNYKRATSQHPLDWMEIQNLSKQGGIRSLNDQSTNTFFFNSNDPILWESSVIRINSDGSSVHLLDNISHMLMYTSIDNDIFLMSGFPLSNLIYSHDNGNNWSTINITASTFGGLFNYNVYKGNICNPVYPNNNYGCIDTKLSPPSVKYFKLPPNIANYAVFQIFTDATGVWLTANKDYAQSNKPYIYYYDINSGQLTDTEIGLVASDITIPGAPQARSIGDHELLTCGKNLAQNFSAFYYNGSTWKGTAINLPNSTNCCLSYAGTSNNPLFSTDDKNVWIYGTNSKQCNFDQNTVVNQNIIRR